MKTINAILFCLVILLTSSCQKTYTCKCSYPGSSATYSTGQVKAISEKKAKERCGNTCQGGIISVK